MHVDLVDLRLFVAVAEARSITHGAERSALALASASARIKGMEAALGVALLERQRRASGLRLQVKACSTTRASCCIRWPRCRANSPPMRAG